MDHPISHPEADGHSANGPQLRLHAEAELPPAFVPLRLVLQGTGTFVEVTRPDAIIGRHTEADIRLSLPDVSRRHCRVQFLDGGWQVMDLSSLNGIQINGEVVLQAPLAQDDILRIGGFHFVVDLTNAGLGGSNHVQSILKSLDAPRLQAS